MTAVGGAAAFNFFHLEPTGRFTIADAENWVALALFLVAARIASSVAELARSRAREAQSRRAEADLAAELARCCSGAMRSPTPWPRRRSVLEFLPATLARPPEAGHPAAEPETAPA